MRILIAEDDFTSRAVLTAMLGKWGHAVVATVDGADALKAMGQSDAPKLAILDWMMPELDGIEVVRRVRAMQDPEPPYIIMLTSKDDKSNIIAGLDAGANDYLTKPFDIGELRARIQVGQRMIEMQTRLAEQVLELHKAIEQIKTLQGIIPICMFCKKIRNDQGFWDQVETYISKHSGAIFSHGACPKCIKKHYPDIYEEGHMKQGSDGS